MRATVVAGVAAAFAILALASLSPTAQRPRANVADPTSSPVPIAVVAYSRDPLAIARADNMSH